MPTITPSSLFIRIVWQSAAVLIVALFTFFAHISSEAYSDRIADQQTEATLLTDELRMTTTGLVRMARGYIVTGNPIYKQGFQKILDIREGLAPRPSGYHETYWDLILPSEKHYSIKTAETIPLLELLREIPFTKPEFAKLAKAKKSADTMAHIEIGAMTLADSVHPMTQTNQNQALLILESSAHHQAKVNVREAIDDFYSNMNTRMTYAHNQAKTVARYLETIFALLILACFIMLWRLYKTLHAILGTEVDDLRTHIERITNGDFSRPITVKKGMENSVAEWLSKMQIKLKELMSANLRQQQLYSALSQCNHAIVRSANEAELMPKICRIAVDYGGMKMVWIGMVNPQKSKITPVAYYGQDTEFLKELIISTNPSHFTSQGPIGRAFRDNLPYWVQDFENDSLTSAWAEWGKIYGWGSIASLPITRDGEPVGVITLYAQEREAFDEAAQKLLVEMAMDISFALDNYAAEVIRIEAEYRIEYMAHFDMLTGLPNRSQLEDRFEYTLSLTKRHNGHSAMMFIDLDHFKEVNDSLSHSIGDLLLIEVAKRLLSMLREEDTLSRMGGDEFILLLPDTNSNGAIQVAQKLLDIFSEPFFIESYELTIGASIGITICPSDGTDKETLLKNADTAMYRAKKEGRNRYCFFTEEMQKTSMRRHILSNALRHALQNNEFEVVYQPQISTHTTQLVGAEALLRWNSAEHGSVSPAEFIPIAEENGMILQIGEWVIRTAITQTKRWMDQGMEPFMMAVNLSAVQFHHSDLLEMVMGILREVGLSSEYLELELTEGMAMHNPHAAITIMNNFHEQGIRMSIDDFGTGYSSLSYLKKFKIYKLKIDQSFVCDIDTDPDDKAIVTAIVKMAHSLGLQTIAEGVETIEQLNYLREIGCDEIQGYYYSKPLSAENYELFSRNRVYVINA